MSPKYRRQNRNVCDLVLIFSQNQRLFFLKLNYTEVLHSTCYGLYRDKTKLFLISWGDFEATWLVRGCWQALNHASIALVTKYRQLAHLNTTFNDEKFFLIAIKILRLKRSLSWGHNLRKRIVLVLLTAVDLRRSIMCAAWPDNICLESTSLPPKGFQEVLLISITIFIFSYLHFFFFYKCKFFEDICHSRSRLFTTMYYVTKRKSLQCFDQRISRAFPGNLHIF